VETHLKILHTVAEAVSRTLDVDEVVHTALDALTSVTGHEISSLHLVSPDGKTMHLRGDRGLSPRMRDLNSVLEMGEMGLISRVAATGKTLNFANVGEAPELLPAAKPIVKRDHIRAFVCVPIHSRGRILGTLSLGRRNGDPFDELEVALVEATADQIGIALDNARLYSETRRQLDELKLAQAQLIRAEKLSAVGELASGVAHEINNPLTTILGQAHLLLARPDVSEYLRERLTVIAEETSRAARIVQNLLVFARHYPPERRPTLLPDLVVRVLDLVAYQVEKDRIRIVTQFDETPPVLVDEHQLQQVLLNLIQNAHHAMAKQRGDNSLTVRVRALREHAVLEVVDTGHGIPPEALPRVFDPFFTTKPPGEGSGLGLSVSYGIVTEHGGRLRGENRPEGGAIFTVELPWAASRP
jgi:C4-dicarboxylate-specific signal transduction histidine kinase